MGRYGRNRRIKDHRSMIAQKVPDKSKTTAEGWRECSPEEAAVNQKARDLLASIKRTQIALDKMKEFPDVD